VLCGFACRVHLTFDHSFSDFLVKEYVDAMEDYPELSDMVAAAEDQEDEKGPVEYPDVSTMHVLSRGQIYVAYLSGQSSAPVSTSRLQR
jgi:hypothetical protein